MYKKITIGLCLVILIFLSYWFLSSSGTLQLCTDKEALQERLNQLSFIGPLMIILLMAVSIIFSPLPRAPIALASGSAYGHTWGTIYILIGAEIGAIVAFTIARVLGYEVLRKWFGKRLSLGLLGSQNLLMGIVFLMRLMPFVSFDFVSYAAGLTPLSAWRFALATLAGMAPASFLLAHFGSEFRSGDINRILISIALLGVIALIPIVIKLFRKKFR